MSWPILRSAHIRALSDASLLDLATNSEVLNAPKKAREDVTLNNSSSYGVSQMAESAPTKPLSMSRSIGALWSCVFSSCLAHPFSAALNGKPAVGSPSPLNFEKWAMAAKWLDTHECDFPLSFAHSTKRCTPVAGVWASPTPLDSASDVNLSKHALYLARVAGATDSSPSAPIL
ncbi:hypothetical protein NDU88_006957 [Pleurodeles waltl]|uniref:Uncharacterized protein n=1 Tax=Pleurodeles waltl TaxID=8319 RepID=A0AAV7NRP0_PLEWA|nr:hypothetical protein NDU88_006957 [Pleurodeles waltl]